MLSEGEEQDGLGVGVQLAELALEVDAASDGCVFGGDREVCASDLAANR